MYKNFIFYLLIFAARDCSAGAREVVMMTRTRMSSTQTRERFSGTARGFPLTTRKEECSDSARDQTMVVSNTAGKPEYQTSHTYLSDSVMSNRTISGLQKNKTINKKWKKHYWTISAFSFEAHHAFVNKAMDHASEECILSWTTPLL